MLIFLMPNPPPVSPPSLLSLSHLWLYRSPEQRESGLFRNLNLELQKGETLAIVGPSGEGKTILLKVMAGLISPNEGGVFFEGVALSNLSRPQRTAFSRRLGMTFQRSGLFDSLSCGENLRFPLRELTPLSSSEIEEKVAQALREVGLEGLHSLMVPELSGGMQKRVGIARALVLSPEIILYDDPTAGLDPVTSRAISDLIQKMKEKYGMTVVCVTSDLKVADRLADRIGFLYQGEFLALEDPRKIRESEHPVIKQFFQGLIEGPLTPTEEAP